MLPVLSCAGHVQVQPEVAMKVLKDLVFSIWEGERCEDFSDTRKMLGLVRLCFLALAHACRSCQDPVPKCPTAAWVTDSTALAGRSLLSLAQLQVRPEGSLMPMCRADLVLPALLPPQAGAPAQPAAAAPG